MAGTDTQFVMSFVKALSRIERQLLMLYYAERLTPAEIGLVLNIAEARVTAMLDDLVERVRAALRQKEPLAASR